MSQEDLTRELIEILLQGVDVKVDAQQKRLESYAKKHRYVILLGMDAIHSDTTRIREDVAWSAAMVFDSMLDESLDAVLKEWENPKRRAMAMKDLRDTFTALPLMKGIRGASLVDKKLTRGVEIEL